MIVVLQLLGQQKRSHSRIEKIWATSISAAIILTAVALICFSFMSVVPPDPCDCQTPLQITMANPPTNLGGSFPLIESMQDSLTSLDGDFDDLIDAAAQSSSRPALSPWVAHGVKNTWWNTCLHLADHEIAQMVPPTLLKQLADGVTTSKQVWHDTVHALRERLMERPSEWFNRSHCLVKTLSPATQGIVPSDASVTAAAEAFATSSLRFCYAMVLQPHPLKFLTKMDTRSTKAFDVVTKTRQAEVSMSCALPALVTAQGVVVYPGIMYQWGGHDDK